MFHPSEVHTFGDFELVAGHNVMSPRPGWVTPLFRSSESMGGNYPFFTQDIDEFGNVRGFFPVSIGPNCNPDQDEIICRRVTQSAIHGYQLKNGNVVFASLSELREVVASDFKNIEDMPYATYEASLFLNDGPAKKQAVQKLSKLPENILIYEDRTVVNRTKPLAVIPKVSGKEVDDWASQAEHLAHELGENNFKYWVEPLRFNGVSDSVGRFEAPTRFMANYVAQNFSDIILSRLQRVDENIQRLEFGTTENFSAHPTQDNTTKSQSSAHGERTHEELPGAPYEDRFNFDTFVVGKPNELAHAAARRVAEADKVTFNPLFLYGGVGLGKTHLMHAIAWELTRQNPNSKVLYLSAEQFMYRFVQALRERRMMNFKEIFRTVDVLMVDDVQFIAGKDSTQEEFFHTFNALIDQNKQIVISADRAPDEIKDLENRIRSRLQSGLVVDLHPTDYELRLGILQVKIEIYLAAYENVELRGGVLEFLAQRITTNVRVLEGALTRLFAFSSLTNRPITVELAQYCLSDILRASERKISIEEIQRKVAEHYNIRLSDMIGPRTVKIFARPRQVAMFLSRALTSRSLPEIGRRFGGRSEATVRSNVKKVEALKATDGQIADDLELLRRFLEA